MPTGWPETKMGDLEIRMHFYQCSQGVIYTDFYFTEAVVWRFLELELQLALQGRSVYSVHWSCVGEYYFARQILPGMVVSSHPALKTVPCCRSFNDGVFLKALCFFFVSMNKQELHFVY